MNTVNVRNIEIGSGKPKVIVPIVAVTKEDILKEAAEIASLPADVLEWRVDWFENSEDLAAVKDILKGLREVLGDMPILMTFRTKKEGGEKAISMQDYIDLNVEAAKSGLVDLVDVEIFSGDDTVSAILDGAHANGVKVVASNHDFFKTPDQDDIVSRLVKMQEMGADICKIAVMPQNRRDVLTLLSATEKMANDIADRPIITMSMAKDGVISRLCGEVFGSSMTFGAAGKASAPGQMNVETLVQILDALHQAL